MSVPKLLKGILLRNCGAPHVLARGLDFEVGQICCGEIHGFGRRWFVELWFDGYVMYVVGARNLARSQRSRSATGQAFPSRAFVP